MGSELTSRGATLLVAALKKRGMTREGLEEKLGAGSGMVSRWTSGKARPSLDWAKRLEDTLGVPMAAWAEAPKNRRAA